MLPHLLIVDDQEAIRLFLATTLEVKGYRVSAAGAGREALALAAADPPDLVLLDLQLPDMNGLDVLAQLKAEQPDACVVILTSFGRADAAVEAMRRRAFDFVTKPVNLDHLLQVVQRGLATRESDRRLRHRGSVADLFAMLPTAVPCQSAAMAPVYETVRKIAAGGRSTVLIQGESGTGKDILVQVIHTNSSRREFPCLEINCASLPEQLLESELFGHEKGAFTDAGQQKLGLLELAHGGTLFLDEIGEMPLAIQVKVLRVLEKMTFKRVGGLTDIQVDVRIIAATNRDLAALVEQGGFRSDLYYRLKVIQVTVPPLRQRPEDIPALARHFLRQYNEEFGKRFEDLSAAAMAQLQAQAWPGNVRQLRNTIERSVLLEEGALLDVSGLHLDTDQADFQDENAQLIKWLEQMLTGPFPIAGLDLDSVALRIERAFIQKALKAAGNNQSQAARLLKLGRDRLRYRLKQYQF
ncbi:MAG: sigma-54 dependent transcriptional regulator [Candidatus Krumholzibacteria bacterium]|jgi:two-component system response regulator AtoC|nr:sigma-54 dependent transcriptional regulator [Candidatus Krumholzibacteria bacterium]